MISPQDELRAQWKADLDRLIKPKTFLRLLVLGGIGHFASLALLGIAFFLIWMGAWYALTRLAMYWAPIYRAFATIQGVQLGPGQPAWRFAPISGWHVPGLVLRTTISALFIGFGIALLFKTGFCGQNLICLIASNGLPMTP